MLVVFKEMNRLLNSTYSTEVFDLERFRLFVHKSLAEKSDRRTSMLLKSGGNIGDLSKQQPFMKTIDSSDGFGDNNSFTEAL